MPQGTNVLVASAGVFHSTERLIEMLSNRGLPAEELTSIFRNVLVCPPHIVINLGHRCGWIDVDSEGRLQVTQRGRQLASARGFESRLRMQISDFLRAVRPQWIGLVTRGRSEFARFAPREVVQVFREAELLREPATDADIDWWDGISSAARSTVEARLLETGRSGERLTLRHELARTSQEPRWQSIESNLCGYDILSVVAADNKEPLRIEVKASNLSPSSALCYISRHEWAVAESGGAHLFHLWLLGSGRPPRVASLEPRDIAPHIPLERGRGEWESVAIPFEEFGTAFSECLG